MPMPTITYGQTRPTMSRVERQASRSRSSMVGLKSMATEPARTFQT